MLVDMNVNLVKVQLLKPLTAADQIISFSFIVLARILLMILDGRFVLFRIQVEG